MAPVIYALAGGILPALIWLFFWLREDSRHPEPDGLILKTFLLGMLAVVLVLPFQKGVETFFPSLAVLPLFLWALLEEVFKFGAGYFGGLHSVEDNEPLDPLIYMITAALGFVALENALFIFGPLLDHNLTQGLITGNLRFIGASLLHVVSSGFIGVALSLSFYQSRSKRIFKVALGLIAAVLFHLVFNLLIVNVEGSGTTAAFTVVWVGVALLLLAFEKIKTIAPR
ncbi:MAG: PrsW family glutamic-type intramembrane protease [Patescibacteria group bacterium]